jgi:hypothetical protein
MTYIVPTMLLSKDLYRGGRDVFDDTTYAVGLETQRLYQTHHSGQHVSKPKFESAIVRARGWCMHCMSAYTGVHSVFM